jgi:hypothetical protein
MPPPPDPARIAVAQLQGAAKHWARYRRTSREEALAELGEILHGRDDGPALLAEAAGILLGACREPELEAEAGRAAGLLREAGADETLIPEWIEVGRQRVRDAAEPPFGVKLIQQRRGD